MSESKKGGYSTINHLYIKGKNEDRKMNEVEKFAIFPLI